MNFVIHSLIINFIIQPSPSNKNHHKQTCNRATLRSFSVKKIVVRMKNVKFRGKRRNAAVYSSAEIPRQPKFRGSPNSAATRGPRKKLWALIMTTKTAKPQH